MPKFRATIEVDFDSKDRSSAIHYVRSPEFTKNLLEHGSGLLTTMVKLDEALESLPFLRVGPLPQSEPQLV